MNPYLKTNLARWNELAAIHQASEFYDVHSFKQGKSSLKSVELEALGDINGKSILHLQCHFGMDSLSLARLGAKVTGVDFSDQAIELARSLNDELGLDAEFVCSNIYELKDALVGQFDIVYTSYGVLCWLPDLDSWADIIAHYLKPGGKFLIVEGHPVANLFELDDKRERLEISYSYFNKRTPTEFVEDATYADKHAKVINRSMYEWDHSLSEIMGALLSSGLIITNFQEYPFGFYDKFDGLMEQSKDGSWKLKGKYNIPLIFSITAEKRLI